MMGNNMVSYRVKRVKGRYYLVKRIYDRSSKKVKDKSLGPIDLIEELLHRHKVEKLRQLAPRPGFEPGSRARQARPKLEPKAMVSQVPHIQVELDDLSLWEKWCLGRGASPETCRGYFRYLLEPLDPDNRWSVKAYKSYLKWDCERGRLEACDDYKRVKVPQARPDLRVPGLDEVKRSLQAAGKYRPVYQVLVSSGLRLNEAVHLINSIGALECVGKNGFHRCNLGLQRGKKRAFWAYLVTIPQRPGEPYNARLVTSYAEKNGLVMPKYIRKFVATKMAELDIPPHIIDFIQGRAPRGVLLQHYAQLVGQADKWYPIYAQWLRKEGLLLTTSNGV